jgi:hypothetical protein
MPSCPELYNSCKTNFRYSTAASQGFLRGDPALLAVLHSARWVWLASSVLVATDARGQSQLPLACPYDTDARGQSHPALAFPYGTNAPGQRHPSNTAHPQQTVSQPSLGRMAASQRRRQVGLTGITVEIYITFFM